MSLRGMCILSPVCLSFCVSRAAFFVFYSKCTNNSFNSYMHLCPYCCAQSLAHMPLFLFHLHLYFFTHDMCLCTDRLYPLPSLLTYIHVSLQIYSHVSHACDIFLPFHRRLLFHMHIHLSPYFYVCMFQLSYTCHLQWNSREKLRKCISVTGSLRGQAQVRPIDKLDEACTNADDRMIHVQHCSGDRVMS